MLLPVTSFTALRQTHASSRHSIHLPRRIYAFSPSLHSLPPSNPRFFSSLHSLTPVKLMLLPLHFIHCPPSNPRFFPSLHSLPSVKPTLLPFKSSHDSYSTFAACHSLFQDRRQRFTSYLQLLPQHPFNVPCISPKRTQDHLPMTSFKSSSSHQILMARSIPHGKGPLRTCRRSVVDKRVRERHAAAVSSIIFV